MQGASVVFTATSPAMLASDTVFMASVLPGLKPYQPNHRKNVPKTTNGMLWPLNSSGSSQRSLRAPT